jgi:predicted Zn-dependent protease
MAHGHESAGRAVLERELAWLASLPADQQRTAFVRFERAQALYAADLGDSARAIVEILVHERPEDANYAGLLGVLAAQRGERAEAERLDSALSRLERPLCTAVFWRACIAARLGHRDQAVAFLARGRTQGLWLFQNAQNRQFWHILGPHVEPSFTAMRGYPPFDELVRPKG